MDRNKDNRPFGEEDDRNTASDREHMSTNGLVANLTREDLTFSNELEDVDEQGLDSQSGQQAQQTSIDRAENGNEDYQDEEPGFNSPQKPRDESESYTDYNGNSEQNAPAP
ncbi:MAG TPA: hypothetical protein VHK69_09095 [Chitinophagaceae bacterium]|nr:hypothetical protein [Chitinophagaceae bacterium]